MWRWSSAPVRTRDLFRSWSSRVVTYLAWVTTSCTLGCADRQPYDNASVRSAHEWNERASVKIVIHGAENLNDQHSCYVLVRTIEDKPTSATTYAQSVELAKKPDESVKAVDVLLPGQTRELSVSPPKQGQLVVEALLRSPDPSAWRVYVPAGTREIEIQVTERRACVIRPATGQECEGK